MNTATTRNAVKKFKTWELMQARTSITLEMAAAIDDGVRPTQAHVGQIELLTAIGDELAARGELASVAEVA